MTNDQAIGQYLFHLVGRGVDGDTHERAPAVRAMHDAEHVRGQLFAEVVALADAAREVGETFRLETAAQRLVAPGQPAVAAAESHALIGKVNMSSLCFTTTHLAYKLIHESTRHSLCGSQPACGRSLCVGFLEQ